MQAKTPVTQTLTPKEKRFCDEYIIDLTATQAAIRAGYSRHTARSIGSENLTKPAIIAKIEISKANRAERTGIDAAWALTRLVTEVEADINDIFDDEGAVLPVSEWPLIWRQGLITGIDVEIIKGPDGTEMGMVKKIRFSDRLKRLELIARHVNVKAFDERVSIGIDDIPGRMERELKRMAGMPLVPFRPLGLECHPYGLPSCKHRLR